MTTPTQPPSRTLSERLVNRASGLFASRQSRRSFLTRTAVVGSALAVDPFGYILKPGTAYGALCGTCSDGWTAFCCTINSGQNSCPTGSFVGGWWKADHAAFCCGAARYIIDCNASCPTSCRCRCTGASCDGRRTCCNQFRYGQCNQQISCYGPVVCRVATCTPPWQYDTSCTSTSATDNNTVTHGAPCLDDECGTAISKLYASLGGASGVLGAVTQSERAVANKTGRYALYKKGSIFERNGKAAFALQGTIAARYAKLQYHRGPMGYPTTNQGSIGDSAKGVYNRFDNGVIYATTATGAFEVTGAIRTLHSSIGGVKGPLGYPKAGPLIWAGTEHPYQQFQQGSVWSSFGGGTRWMSTAATTRFLAIGGPDSALGWPTADPANVAHGAIIRFQHGAIYTSRLGTFDLEGPVQAKYVELGELSSSLGVPISSLTPSGSQQFADFQFGRLTYDASTGTVTQSGPTQV